MREIHRHTLPAGRYYIGDQCYCLGDSRKAAVHRQVFGNDRLGNEELPTLVTLDGRQAVVFSTDGDGEFEDNFGRVYPVDTGSIGITPVEVADGNQCDDCHLATFDKSFDCVYYRDGMYRWRMVFGDVEISLDPQ